MTDGTVFPSVAMVARQLWNLDPRDELSEREDPLITFDKVVMTMRRQRDLYIFCLCPCY